VTKPQVYCIGELLIDMFCTDVDIALKDGENFKKMAGGAPANVAVAVSRLGGNAAFIGKVGNDAFGDFLVNTLEKYQVDVSMIVRDNNTPTTIAFVSLTRDGERDFQFNRGADENFSLSDVPVKKILQSNILHFGSATALLPDGIIRETYFSLMNQAKSEDKFISFDPNYRHDLWKGRESEFIKYAQRAVGMADFVKVSEEELKILTNEDEVSYGVATLHRIGASIVAVTMGEAGAIISDGNQYEQIPSEQIKPVDSTGAGDAFVGAVLYQMAHQGTEAVIDDFSKLKKVVQFANKVGAVVCTKIGSLTALPTLDELED